MTESNKNLQLARAFVDGLKQAGLDSVCIPPGSRSTPLTLAFSHCESIRIFSHLDERSAAYFCLGRAKKSGRPTPLLSTSGTGAVNFHPAVVEADRAHVPMIVLTADRPPELQDSGANQTVDQLKLYGDHVRWFFQMPEPKDNPRTLRSVREKATRALLLSTGNPPGPVHLNFPFRKPLQPASTLNSDSNTSGQQKTISDTHRIEFDSGEHTISCSTADSFSEKIKNTPEGLLIAGPEHGENLAEANLDLLSKRTGYPLITDPLSNLRFGKHVDDTPIVGGYDGYLRDDYFDSGSAPDLVIRFGATPTSKNLQKALRNMNCKQVLVNPSASWNDPTFASRHLVQSTARSFADALLERLPASPLHPESQKPLLEVEQKYWKKVDETEMGNNFEGAYIRTVIEEAPVSSVLFVSNSMPIRDVDRFGKPSTTPITVLGNRGASGIDGITSTALGAGSIDENPLTLITGDLAFYHDMNGLLALRRFNLNATIVLINNNGGGIFHMLPIEKFDPPFTELFRTPHEIDFGSAATLYGLEHERVESVHELSSAYRHAINSDQTCLLEVCVDSRKSHRRREQLEQKIHESII